MSKLSLKIFSAVISATLILGSISFGAFAAPKADPKAEVAKVKNNAEKNMQINKEKEHLLAAKITMTKLIKKNETFTMNMLKNNMVRVAIKIKQDGKMVLINELIIDNGKIIANKEKDMLNYAKNYRKYKIDTKDNEKLSLATSNPVTILTPIPLIETTPSITTVISIAGELTPSSTPTPTPIAERTPYVDDPKTNLDDVYGHQLEEKLPILSASCNGTEISSNGKIYCENNDYGLAKIYIHKINMYPMNSKEAKALDKKYGFLSQTIRNGKVIDNTKELNTLILVDVEFRNESNNVITSMGNQDYYFQYQNGNYYHTLTKSGVLERITTKNVMPTYNNSNVLNMGFAVESKSSFRTQLWYGAPAKADQIKGLNLFHEVIIKSLK